MIYYGQLLQIIRNASKAGKKEIFMAFYFSSPGFVLGSWDRREKGFCLGYLVLR